MASFSSRPDVVVVGAGAAGIAAGRELTRRGISHLIVEARERIGGRAWTEPCGTPYPFDLGCEWLHSADRNRLAELAPTLGFALDKAEPPWRRRHPQVGFGDADQEAFGVEQDAFYRRLALAADEVRRNGRDRPASDFLDPSASWNALTDAVSTYYNGAPLSRVSVLDFDRYVDTEENWRVTGGYGAMVAAAGAGLPLRLGCRVTRIDATGRAIVVATDHGSIEADKVVVTVPTSVLASGAIAFDPALDDHLAAAAALPLGVADKLFFALDDADAFPSDTRLIGAPDRTDTGTYTLRPRGRAIVDGYFGGDYARHLEKDGLAAFADAGRREIAAALGRDIGAKLKPIAATGWAGDPLSLGSYSHALPGHADARAVLATPIDDRLYFAGEATSRGFFSTAHGAFEEGTRAARAITTAGQLATAGVHR